MNDPVGPCGQNWDFIVVTIALPHTQSCSSQIHPRTAPSQHPESTAQRAETSSARRMSPQPRSPAARQCSWCSWSLFFPFRCLFFGVFVSPLTYAYFPHAFFLCLRFDPLLIPLRCRPRLPYFQPLPVSCDARSL